MLYNKTLTDIADFNLLFNGKEGGGGRKGSKDSTDDLSLYMYL